MQDSIVYILGYKRSIEAPKEIEWFSQGFEGEKLINGQDCWSIDMLDRERGLIRP